MTVKYCFSPIHIYCPKQTSPKQNDCFGFVINDDIRRNCHFVNLIFFKVNKIFLPIYLADLPLLFLLVRPAILILLQADGAAILDKLININLYQVSNLLKGQEY